MREARRAWVPQWGTQPNDGVGKAEAWRTTIISKTVIPHMIKNHAERRRRQNRSLDVGSSPIQVAN